MEQTGTEDGPASGPARRDPHAEQVAAVQKGYGFAGAALELGALVVDADGTPTPRPDAQVRIPLAMLNRHGLVAGATGTGKTKTLQVMAEQLSAAGVPVFLADIKGDLSGVAVPGTANDKLTARTRGIGQDWQAAAVPHRVPRPRRARRRASRSGPASPRSGPDLLAKVLDLNDTQTSSLALVFHYADTAGLPLLDLADLRAVVQHLVSDEGKADLKGLGGLSAATAGVILRELVAFAAAGADAFFGEPELDPADLLRVDAEGRGIVTCLELAEVQDRPALFSTFLLWLLAELFEDAARGRRPRQAQARLLLRRGAPAVQRRLRGVPRQGHPDRAAHPVQGRRHLLRHPDPQGRARRRARPARQPGPARPARLHPGRRQGPQGHRQHVPDLAATTWARCSPRSASARPWSRCCPSGARPRRSPGPCSAPRRRRCRPMPADALAAAVAASPLHGPLRRRGRPGVRLRDAQRAARVGDRGARRAAGRRDAASSRRRRPGRDPLPGPGQTWDDVEPAPRAGRAGRPPRAAAPPSRRSRARCRRSSPPRRSRASCARPARCSAARSPAGCSAPPGAGGDLGRAPGEPGPVALVGSGEYLPVMHEVEASLLAGRAAPLRPARHRGGARGPALPGPLARARPAGGRAARRRAGRRPRGRPGVRRRPRPRLARRGRRARLPVRGQPEVPRRDPPRDRGVGGHRAGWRGGAALAGCSAGAMAMGSAVPDVRHPLVRPGRRARRRPAPVGRPALRPVRLPAARLVRRPPAAGRGPAVGIDEETALVGGPAPLARRRAPGAWLLDEDGRHEHPAGDVVTSDARLERDSASDRLRATIDASCRSYGPR